MKKVMKVELRENRSASATEGSRYLSESWEIKFDSLDDTQKKSTPLEQHMLARLKEALPESFQPQLDFLMYGDLSQGGSVIYGDITVSVAFSKIQSPTLP